MINDTFVKKYCSEIKKICPLPLKKSLMLELSSSTDDFLENNPNATEEMFYQHFGRPEEFLSAHLTNMTPSEQAAILSKTKFTKKVVVISAAVFLVITASLAVWIGVVNSRNASAYYETEVVLDTQYEADNSK